MQQKTRVYLDNAATTPLCDAAQNALREYSQGLVGNASSPYEAGRGARMAIDEARAQVADLIGAAPDEIVFTSGGTESDNWALLGMALQNIENRGHVIVSQIEHHAVLEAAATLADLGFQISFARPDSDGVVAPDEVARLLRDDTLLVSLMLCNNETGAMQPVVEVGKIACERGVLFHTDAVQAAGKIELDVRVLAPDFLTLSAHKFGGARGAGALYVRRGAKLYPLLRGGGQERGRRAGTENVAAIAAMGAAAETAQREREAVASHLEKLRAYLESGLRNLGAQINAEGAPRAPHIANAAFAGMRAESLALRLDLMGFAVGTGSACASGAIEPSHVLAAMGRSTEEARAALRISLGAQNTRIEVDELLCALKEIRG